MFVCLALHVIVSSPFAHAAQLSLTWSDMSANEDGFQIERKMGTGGTYTTIATPAAGTTGYVDGTVTAGTTYCYRVNAYNSAGASGYSNEACAAAAVPVTYAVTVTKSGAGSGTVASSPPGIDCGSDCSEPYASQTSIALAATPAPGATFTGWSGACTGTGSCLLYVDAAKSLTATFALATNTLTVTKAGSGTGTVTSNPAGITCSTDCSEPYASGTSVTLTAAPAAGSTFTGWTGACSGTGTCTVSMTAARSVTATFALATNTLSVTKAGSGTGTVTSNPTGIGCGTDCSESYSYNTSVTLTAAATAGSTFTGWSGACSGTGTCTVSMTAARSVTATFALNSYALTVASTGTGSGTVTSNPTGVTCGTDCTETYSYNTNVTLTAAASAGSTFTGWSGACSGTATTCTVAMSVARSVTATFGAVALPTPSSYTFGVSKTGSGTGIVASNPAGINCGPTCNASFPSGVSVALEAIPDAGSTFTGWSGACAGTGPCTVAINQAQSVTATFGLQHFPLSVMRSGTDAGTVISSPSGIACGSDCNETYSYNTNVTLTAAPPRGFTFTGWSGDCSGTALTCAVTMNRTKTATANFTDQRTTYTLRVSRNGRGAGSVTSTPAGIACARDCREDFASGTSVTLTAAPGIGSIFAGWSGACTGTGTCTVTLTQSSSVTAWFTRPHH